MRLTCSQKNLAGALVISSKAVNTNNTLPVLNNVLLKAEGKKLYFTATNLEIAISYWIEADVKNEGEITIPSRLFTNYVGYLNDEKIEITMEEGNAVMVKSADSVTKIKGIPASEFPPIPAVEKEGGTKVSKKDLKQAIDQVVFAASLNATRPTLAGVYLCVEKDQLKLVATDSYRLGEKTLKAQKITGTIHCIIPARTCIELVNILGLEGEDETVEITVSKNQVLFHVGEIKIISRLIEGQFPNYQQIIPKSSKTQAHFNINELTLALKRINIFAKENNNKIIFRTHKNEVVITTDTTQYGEGEIRLKVKVEGVDNEVALNSQYLLDVLGNLTEDEVTLEMGEKTTPVIIRSAKSNDYLHIIMPLKI